jgi:hypothetical protein
MKILGNCVFIENARARAHCDEASTRSPAPAPAKASNAKNAKKNGRLQDLNLRVLFYFSSRLCVFVLFIGVHRRLSAAYSSFSDCETF